MEEMAAHAKTLKANHDATFSEPMKRYCIWKWHVCTFTQVGHTRLAFRYNICLIRKGRNPLGTLGNAVVRISWKDECPYWAVWAPIACVQPFEKMPIQSVHSSLTFCLCMYSRPRVFVVCVCVWCWCLCLCRYSNVYKHVEFHARQRELKLQVHME
jgi:hypothetical protein